MKEKTCCFTGHRVIEAKKIPLVKQALTAEITARIKEGYEIFVTGGAIGFDTLAADSVLELKKTYPHIKLQLVLPCKNQDIKWRYEQKKHYAEILSSADSCEYVSSLYTPTCMKERNKKMIELSSALIAYCDIGKLHSGSVQTLNFARKSGIKIYNLI